MYADDGTLDGSFIAFDSYQKKIVGSGKDAQFRPHKKDVNIFFWFNTFLLCEEGIQSVSLGLAFLFWEKRMSRCDRALSARLAKGFGGLPDKARSHRGSPVSLRIDLDNAKAYPPQALADLIEQPRQGMHFLQGDLHART